MKQTHKRFVNQCLMALVWILGMLWATCEIAVSYDDNQLDIDEGSSKYIEAIAIGNSSPGKVTLISPWGSIKTNMPTYMWYGISEATWYYLWVDDSTGTRIQKWYKAADANCTGVVVTCSVTPQIALAAGPAKWWIQTWNAEGLSVWSDGMDFSMRLPGNVKLISPSENIKTNTPSYTWNADPDATWYYLWVNDSKGTKIQQWYTGADAGCPDGSGSCSVTPQIALAGGSAKWWIQAWNPNGYGPWSDGLAFSVGLPGKADLVSPWGKITKSTPTYIWDADPDSTWYYLWVDDNTGTKIQQWFAAAEAGCADGVGGCSVSPGKILESGAGKWWIQTWNPNGYGPWSDALTFTVNTSAKGKWSSAGHLNFERAFHTAALLSNGNVLVAGGQSSGDTILSSSELYDPESRQWSEAGNLNFQRLYATATSLSNGKVLVAGGISKAGNLVSSELFNPETGQWSETGNLSLERSVHTATLLPNGKVLVTGGLSGSSGGAGTVSCELYDLEAGQWFETGSLKYGRFGHTATLLTDGRVLVTGGATDEDHYLISSELYDPATGKWSQTGNLNFKRTAHTATLLPNGKLLVAGGLSSSSTTLNSSELYDPDTGYWSQTGSLEFNRGGHTATLLNTGEVLVAAGGVASGTTVHISAELYSYESGKWYQAGDLEVARYGHTATLLNTGQVLAAAGKTIYETLLNSSEVYDR